MKANNSTRLWISYLFGLLLAVLSLKAQDLPYDSGSTGADGAFSPPSSYPQGQYYWWMGIYGFTRSGGSVYDGRGAIYAVSQSQLYRSTDGANWSVRDIGHNSYQFSDEWIFSDTNSGDLYFVDNEYDATSHADTDPTVQYWLRVWKSSDSGASWTKVGGDVPSDTVQGYYNTALNVVYLSDSKSILCFGAGSNHNDTWIFDGSTWTKQTPAHTPPPRFHAAIAFDAIRNEPVLFGGQTLGSWISNNDTWTWKGGDWHQKSTVISPPATNDIGAVWDPSRGAVVVPINFGEIWLWTGTEWNRSQSSGFGDSSLAGESFVYLPTSSTLLAIKPNEVRGLKNGVWSFFAGNPYYVDLNTKPDGVFNYTDINIPAGITVKFIRNAANSPVIWLASGFVNIHGAIDVSGSGHSGGPGGYDGAYGLMPSGQGLGGGAGVNNDWGGHYFGVYGNPQIIPLVGGSGGGRPATNYSEGGGGGGAILIAAKRDVLIDGSIQSLGGSGFAPGSGGSIKIVADRILGTGILNAKGSDYYNSYTGQYFTSGAGRIRLEAYQSEILSNTSPLASTTPTPAWTSTDIQQQLQYRLDVRNVAGQDVKNPATGSSNNPDVSFSSADPVNIVVVGQNIPNGTPVKLLISGSGISVTLPKDGDAPVTMQNGSATFSVTIPSGIGQMQASAIFTVK